MWLPPITQLLPWKRKKKKKVKSETKESTCKLFFHPILKLSLSTVIQSFSSATFSNTTCRFFFFSYFFFSCESSSLRVTLMFWMQSGFQCFWLVANGCLSLIHIYCRQHYCRWEPPRAPPPQRDDVRHGLVCVCVCRHASLSLPGWPGRESVSRRALWTEAQVIDSLH